VELGEDLAEQVLAAATIRSYGLASTSSVRLVARRSARSSSFWVKLARLPAITISRRFVFQIAS
jgi:hypothetical protein